MPVGLLGLLLLLLIPCSFKMLCYWHSSSAVCRRKTALRDRTQSAMKKVRVWQLVEGGLVYHRRFNAHRMQSSVSSITPRLTHSMTTIDRRNKARSTGSRQRRTTICYSMFRKILSHSGRGLPEEISKVLKVYLPISSYRPVYFLPVSYGTGRHGKQCNAMQICIGSSKYKLCLPHSVTVCQSATFVHSAKNVGRNYFDRYARVASSKLKRCVLWECLPVKRFAVGTLSDFCTASRGQVGTRLEAMSPFTIHHIK